MADPRSAPSVPRPKVSVPRRIERAVQRPRLLSDLRGPSPDDPAPVVLLACAPAGYGKTTMLVDVASAQRAAGVPVAWVTCGRDEGYADFWGAVLLATTEAARDAGTELVGLDSAPDAVALPSVGKLFEALGEQVPGILLVLDDLHEVRSREVLDGIEHLVEWADGRVRVALGCRFEPPIGLHRLRLTGRLHEVRAAQLAFTPDEADDFWDRHDIVLDAQARASLYALTEGWPAGMRLAALSLEHTADPAGFVDEFGGADRPVADYLTGEVLERLPDDVVDFLLRTCVVQDLTAELANRLSGREDSAAMLDELAQRNALVVPLDRTGTWFRYHALLRTYLTAALQRRHPGEGAALRVAAAQWFLEQGDPGRALELAGAACDTGLVEQILLAHGLGLLLAGNGSAVRRSIGLLSPPAGRRAAALTHRALLAVDDGDLVSADEALAQLDTVPDDGTDGRVTMLRRAAALHRARLAADLTAGHTSELLAGPGPTHLAPGLDPDVRLLALTDRGALRLFEGDEQAGRDLDQAVGLARAAGLHRVELYGRNLVAGAHLARGDFGPARVAAEQAMAVAAAHGWDRWPPLTYSYVIAGWTAFQELRPEEAATWAAISSDVLDRSVDVEVEGLARTAEAIIAFDEPPQRRLVLDRLERVTAWLVDRGGSPALAALAAPHELRMCLALGEWHRADQAVARAQRRLGPGGDVTVLQAQLASARGRPADARRLLRPVLSGEITPLRSTATTTAWLLEALLAERSDRRPAATEALLMALQTAAPTGAIRPFFDMGAQVHGTLALLRGRAGHLDETLEAVSAGIARTRDWESGAAKPVSAPPTGATTSPNGGWLTERELVVLRDLPSMMTLGEIAAAQGISLNTVKTHVRSIYAKLGAGTRREAIAIARGMSLL